MRTNDVKERLARGETAVGTMVFAPGLYTKLPYDIMRDFEHAGLWVTFPLALVVPVWVIRRRSRGRAAV